MRIARFIVPIALAGLVLVGCGNKNTPTTPASSAPVDNGVKALSADEILKKATEALNSAGSFHAKGEMTEEGEKITIDLKVKGKDASGTITMPVFGTIKVLKVGADAWFQADASFWKTFGGEQGDTIATLLKDKWVKATGNKSFEGFTDMADAENLLKPEGTLTKGEEKTINGQATIALKDGATDGGTLYVATTGKPYPIRMEGPKADSGGIDFTEFGASFDDIKAPAAGDVIDISAFMPK